MNWSAEQLSIFSAVANGTAGNLIVEAVAGSGKTTTLVEAIRHIRIQTTSILPPAILFLAFNKAIAETLAGKLGTAAQASTFHSLGLRALKTSFPKIKVDFKKVGNVLYPLFKRDHPDVRPALRAVGLLKSVWPLFSSVSEARDFLTNNDVDFDDEKSLSKVLRVVERTLADTSSCDFDDMLVMPLLYSSEFPKQDFVLVDEAQDTNDVQLEILERLQKKPLLKQVVEAMIDTNLNPHKVRAELEGISYHEAKGRNLGDCYNKQHSPTRFLFVGDPSQAIYGFRGANSDSMERIGKRFSCSSLPLSVTYRCPSLHVVLARRYCAKKESGLITARFDAPLGKVVEPTEYIKDLFVPESVVLCRNTAPLVSMCYNLIHRDVPCRISGKDIGEGLVKLALTFKTWGQNGCEFRAEVSLWAQAKAAACCAEGRSPESFYDKQDALTVLSQDCGDINDMVNRIKRVFDDNPSSSVLLSTIHKFKGGEAKRVFLLDFHRLLPSRYATRPWQLQQERNLQYVAVTRSKEEIFFIESDKWNDNNETSLK